MAAFFPPDNRDEYQDGCISIQIAIHIAKVVFDRTTLAMIIKKALKLRMVKVEQHKDDSDIWSSETQFLYRICPETYAARTKFKPLVRKQPTVYLYLPQLSNL